MTDGLSKQFPLIVADPSTLVGKARIKDTRISVSHVLDLLADGASIDEIHDGWPEISREAIEQAIRYAAVVVAEPPAERIAG